MEDDHIEMSPKQRYGNLIFASPESIQDVKLSRRSDLYSLVYMLIYMKTGKYIFYDKTLSQMENMINIGIGKTSMSLE